MKNEFEKSAENTEEANCTLLFIQPHFSFTFLGTRGCSWYDKLISLLSEQAFYPIRFRVTFKNISLLDEP